MSAIVMWLVKLSIFLGILALGLRATVAQALYLFRHPRLLAATFVAMNVAMPLVAIAIALAFSVDPVIEVTLVTFSVSPVVHLFAHKTLKAGGREDFVVSLFVLTTIASMILIPVTAGVLDRFVGVGAPIPVSAIASSLGITVLLPLIIGLAIRGMARGFAARVAAPFEKLATLLLIAGFVPLFIKVHGAMWALVGDGTLVAIVGYASISMLIAHFAGGRDEANRTVLIVAAVSRHPATALVIARAVAPDEPRIGAAVILLVVVNTVITGIYAARRKHDIARHPVAASAR